MAKGKKDGELKKLSRKTYEKELRTLQAELCELQEWVKHKGLRVIIVFEGRDAAGKGGTIRAITERVSPRVFRVVALPAPSDREKSQMYIQRYMQHFPARRARSSIFDRSWYNRAGVEHVMGFCTEEQHKRFLEAVPERRGVHRRRRHPAHQDLARGQRQGAEAPLRGAHRRPAAPVEAQPDGPALAQQVVRVLARPGPDARRDRHQARAVVHPAFRRQEARAAELHPTHPEPDPLQDGARAKRSSCPKRSMKGAYDDQATLEKRKFVNEVY